MSVGAHRVLTVTLHLHTAERTDALADGLADLLVTPCPIPFAREVVVVPARGVERWLTQRLSHRLGVGARGGDGVCAGVDFVTPHSLVSMLLDKDADDPWDPDRLAWPLLDVIDDVMGEPGFDDLTTHLGGGDPADERSTRRYAVARRLAGLFSSYAVQRPELVARLARRSTTPTAPAATLDPDLRWQAELWRTAGRPGRCARRPTCATRRRSTRLRAGGDDLDLPVPPLAVRPHPAARDRGRAAAARWASSATSTSGCPRPSPALWEALAPTAARGPGAARRRRLGRRWSAHPLLGSLGRDSRELRRTLGDLRPSSTPRATPATPDTLLGWLQADLRANRAPDAATPARGCAPAPTSRCRCTPATEPRARSTCSARCWSGCSQDDPTLEPRDILVMCPDIETYAPLISAGFGLADVAGEERATRPTSCGCGSPTGRSAPPTRCSASPPSSSSWCAGG